MRQYVEDMKQKQCRNNYAAGSSIISWCMVVHSALLYFHSAKTFLDILFHHRRMIKAEDKAKVVASVWGAEYIQFLAALAVLKWDDLKNRLSCTMQDDLKE